MTILTTLSTLDISNNIVDTSENIIVWYNGTKIKYYHRYEQVSTDIENLGFDATVENEIQRLNKTGLIQASLQLTGEKVNFENKKDEIILFRILQEFFSNTLKYAEAENLNVAVNYLEDKLEISVKDDGVGFDINSAEKGSGLINMEKRAELINAKFKLESQLEKGTTLTLVYPYKTI